MNARRAGDGSKGSVLLESALATLVLCGIASGAFYLGWSMILYQRLASSVAAAARYGAGLDLDASNTNFSKIRNMAVSGDPGDASHPLVPGLSAANIRITRTDDAGGQPLALTVSITGFASDLGVATFRAEGRPAVTVRWAGVYKW